MEVRVPEYGNGENGDAVEQGDDQEMLGSDLIREIRTSGFPLSHAVPNSNAKERNASCHLLSQAASTHVQCLD